MHILKALKKLVKDKKIIQTKGNGANGRFKAVKEEKTKINKNFHIPGQTYECPKCGKLFEKLVSLRGHILRSKTCREEILKNHEGLQFKTKKDRARNVPYFNSILTQYLSDHASRTVASNLVKNDLITKFEPDSDYSLATDQIPQQIEPFEPNLIDNILILQPQNDPLINYGGPDSSEAPNLERNSPNLEAVKYKIEIQEEKPENEFFRDPIDYGNENDDTNAFITYLNDDNQEEINLENVETNGFEMISGHDSSEAPNLKRNQKNVEPVEGNELLSNPVEEYETTIFATQKGVSMNLESIQLDKRKHITTNPGRGTFTCNLCDAEFNLYRNTARHIQTVHEKLKVEHPPSTVMVLAAVKALKKPWDSKGSSLVAIKKYIDANYKV